MSITVEVPSHNATIEFPDGTSPDVIHAAMVKNFPSSTAQPGVLDVTAPLPGQSAPSPSPFGDSVAEQMNNSGHMWNADELKAAQKDFVTKEGTLGTRIANTTPFEAAKNVLMEAPRLAQDTVVGTANAGRKLLAGVGNIAQTVTDPANMEANQQKWQEWGNDGIQGPMSPSMTSDVIGAGADTINDALPQGVAGDTARAALSAGMDTAMLVGGAKMLSGPASVAGSAGRVALGTVGDVASSAASKLSPESLYASSLKMSTGKSLSVADRAARAQTGLEGGYVPTEKGYGKLIDDIGDLNDQIGGKIQEAKAGGKMVSIDDVVKPLAEIRDRAQYDINPQPLMDKINEIESNLRDHPLAQDVVDPVTGETTRGIPVDAAQKMKIETYRSLKSAYGEMKSGEVEARKAVARGLKEQIVAAVPEIAELNAKDSALINLEKSLGQATKRIANRDVSGIGGPLKMASGGVVDLMGGHGLGITAGALLWALDNPTVKANLAIALFKARRMAGKTADMGSINAEVGGLAGKIKDKK